MEHDYVMEALEILTREKFDVPPGSQLYALTDNAQPDADTFADSEEPLLMVVYLGPYRTLEAATHSIDFFKRSIRVDICKWTREAEEDEEDEEYGWGWVRIARTTRSQT